jgi:dTDP-4-dehydrorhamnose reductase
MKKVLVLGGTGMLGAACLEVLKKNKNLLVTGTSRSERQGLVKFDAISSNLSELLESQNPDLIINCIGVIKPHINEKDSGSILNAIEVNSIFPAKLANISEELNIKVIQIATDCVYSGRIGGYNETDLHDAEDVYGKTKSLGEVISSNVMHLRVSIIGPEQGRSTSLLEWFRNQPHGQELNGFTDHLWNGVTTYHFARICEGIVLSDNFKSGLHHIIPGDVVAKSELLKYFAGAYSRPDITIKEAESKKKVDRTLKTNDSQANLFFWKNARYEAPPSISEMVTEQSLNSSIN